MKYTLFIIFILTLSTSKLLAFGGEIVFDPTIYQQQLAHDLKELGELEQEVHTLTNIDKYTVEEYKEMKDMVQNHGEWAHIDTGDISGSISYTMDQGQNTLDSLNYVMNNNPVKNVIDHSPMLQKYIPDIDPGNFAVKKAISLENQLSPDTAALKQYEAYEKYRDHIHGYTDSLGYVHKGELDKLNKKLKDQKKALAKLGGSDKNDVKYKTETDKLNYIQTEINNCLTKERDLRGRYEAAESFSKNVDAFMQKVSYLRNKKIDKIWREDDKDNLPYTSSIEEYFEKQEEGVVS